MASISKDDNFQENFSFRASEETIKNKKFEECTFKNCQVINCVLQNCEFISCKFTDCILASLVPTDSTFVEVTFKNCKVTGMDWTKATQTREIVFENSLVNYSNFSNALLPKLKLINCEAKEVIFSGASLEEGDFSGTDFEGSRFHKTNLKKCNFKNAKNYLIDINTNQIKGAMFSYPEVINLLKSLDISVEY